jgi:hypothetical protein
MEALYVEARSRLLPELRECFAGAVFEGTLRERLAELLRRRTRAFEIVAPFRGAPSRFWDRSPVVREGREALDRALRAQLAQALAPELGSRDADLLELLDVTLSFETWNRLRTTQRIGRERTVRLLELAVLSLLGAEG